MLTNGSLMTLCKEDRFSVLYTSIVKSLSMELQSTCHMVDAPPANMTYDILIHNNQTLNPSTNSTT